MVIEMCWAISTCSSGQSANESVSNSFWHSIWYSSASKGPMTWAAASSSVSVMTILIRFTPSHRGP